LYLKTTDLAAESTVKIYRSCINDVAKAMHAAGIKACDLDQPRAMEIVTAMGWNKSRETYARFMKKRFVRVPALSPKEATRLELRAAYMFSTMAATTSNK
jgi:integrase/recombinase XerD